MRAGPLVRRVLRDEALTRGLGDPEARILMEWLAQRVEDLVAVSSSEQAAWHAAQALCRRARALGRFVELWCHRQQRAAAVQLAATERFSWPLPNTVHDPCELMLHILSHENRRFRL
ncbi:MAG: hypothetical protein NZ700_09330 [Gemmataceae bacterium]|nr:hypothetical protein [Gemmataceae bacterium]MDW8266814.1 hypothetical protein [Gemmataceae bacterium]